MSDEFYNKKDLMLGIGKYDKQSIYTAKNIGRYLREKQIPLTFPYNINFSDLEFCSFLEIKPNIFVASSNENLEKGENVKMEQRDFSMMN